MITTEFAQHCLQQHWGLDASLERLDGEQDANFLARCADGSQYVLKIMHQGCDAEDLEFRVSALQHLDGIGPDAARALMDQGVPVGTLVTNPDKAKALLNDGFTFVAVGTDAGVLTQATDALLADVKAGITEN